MMDAVLVTELLRAMGYTQQIVSCEQCKHHREVNEKVGWASLCTFNNIGYIEVSMEGGRCDKFKRKGE